MPISPRQLGLRLMRSVGGILDSRIPVGSLALFIGTAHGLVCRQIFFGMIETLSIARMG